MRTRWIPEDHYNLILSRLVARDRWLVRLLRATGYRVDDVLHTRCWMWGGEYIELKERKTANIRRVTITPEIRRIVEQYKACAGLETGHALSAFVPSKRVKGKIHRTTIWRHFEKAVEECGLSGLGYSLHSLRKCYAIDKFREYGSYERVQADLGHKYLSTTLIYLMDALRAQ